MDGIGVGVEYVVNPDSIRAHLLDALIQKINSKEFGDNYEGLRIYTAALSEFIDIILEHVRD